MRLLSRALAASGLVLALAVTASAQNLQVGIKGGWARPTIGGADATGAESMNTIGGGAFLAAQLSPMFALQPEVLFAPRGFQATAGGVTAKMKLGYVQVPVLAKFVIPLPNSALKPALMAGPYIGLKATCKGEVAGISADCGDADSFKSTDFGASFGGGLQMKVAEKLNGLVEARYDLGLAKIDNSTTQLDEKNRAISVFVGLSLPLGLK